MTAAPGASSASATRIPMAAMARPRATRLNAFTGLITVVFMPTSVGEPGRGVLTNL
jgi:hypothetical protein